MNSPPSQILDRIRRSFPVHDTGELSALIEEEINNTGRRARKDRIKEINAVLLESALELDSPGLVRLIKDISHENLRALFSALLGQYTSTRNEAWFDTIINLIDGMEKKGDQSEIQAWLCLKLIEAGSSSKDQILITRGLDLFSRITFRKYRSEILIQISPFLIDWAVSEGDVSFLRSLQSMTGEIADISKQSVIHARLATAIAAIGIRDDDIAVWCEGIRAAAVIRQKTRRKACFAMIVKAAVDSPVFKKISDIPATAAFLPDLDPSLIHEVVGAILQQVLLHETDRELITKILENLAQQLPSERLVIVSSLLRQAEADGDSWFFMQAAGLQETMGAGTHYPIRHFLRAALSVVRVTGNSDALRLIVPAVASSCPTTESAKILLQIVQVLLSQGELSEALTIFTGIKSEGRRNPQYDECITAIWKHAVITDRVAEVDVELKKLEDTRQWSDAIQRAVDDICKQHPFSEVAEHAGSLAAAIALHPENDQLLSDSVNHLIQRGFLDSADPDVLIRLTRPISDPIIREQTLSTIVIRVARQGVSRRSRDFLQQAVGLSCFIEDEKTRTSTLTAIIDEATMLAVTDRDLDLLRRMREWSASLLPHDSGTAAVAKIIEGMIRYAADSRYPPALDEAYRISSDITDPALRDDVTERISESYVRIGCQLLHDMGNQSSPDDFLSLFRLFEQGLAILTGPDRKDDPSLKIARIIDIILDSSKERFRIDTIIPLALYALEIRQTYERDAMLLRIAPMIRLHTDRTGSTDPYDGIVEVLLHIPYIPRNTVLLDLVQRVAEYIRDPFTRLNRLSVLAGLNLRAGRKEQAQALLDHIIGSLGTVSGEYRKVVLLAECSIHYSSVSVERALDMVKKAIEMLKVTDYDPESYARLRVISALTRLNEMKPDPALIKAAMEIPGQISEPVDRISAMFLVYRMAAGMPEYRSRIVRQIRKVGDEVAASAVRAPLLLDLADFLIQDKEYASAADLLKQISDTADAIEIPFLADTVRSRIAQAYVLIGTWHDNKTCFSEAADIIRAIGHEDIRVFASGLHGKIRTEVSPLFRDIRELAGRMATERYNRAQLDGLETMILSVQDRGLAVRYLCGTAILFRNAGKTRLARYFFDRALSEAGVIRPLSRRAYILCDCALMLHKSGCAEKAQEVVGLAIDAATGIRRFADRDEVFDNLAAAVRWMQEEEPA
ncbi:MAG: hypothetical protein A4E35_01912 [Methanoregula sp. PtaU1.Bin051]|nr:MAG: hypothetical protein A4E35_01912 [Methanoregula sp. PtaU1.Bin051]